jgi:hypothetical protein
MLSKKPLIFHRGTVLRQREVWGWRPTLTAGLEVGLCLLRNTAVSSHAGTVKQDHPCAVQSIDRTDQDQFSTVTLGSRGHGRGDNRLFEHPISLLVQ